MATVVIYDPLDAIAPNRVIQYLASANSPDYVGVPNVLINPDTTPVNNIQWKYWVYDDVAETLAEMTDAQKTTLNQLSLIPNIPTVKIQEEDPATLTSGRFKAIGLKHDVPAGIGRTVSNFTFPYPVSLLSMEFAPLAECEGDQISISIEPETTIGAVTEDVSIGDTTFTVSSTALQYARLGDAIHITEGVTTNQVGYVSEVDTENSTITTSIPTTNAFTAADGVSIQLTTIVLDRVYLHGNGGGVFSLGSSKIGGSYLPANNTIRFSYDNHEGSAKTFYTTLEVLY